MPSPTRNFNFRAADERFCAARISRMFVAGLTSTSEPDEARITRTASLTMSCNASCESSVEWMTLLT